jgi:hypothetical protein
MTHDFLVEKEKTDKHEVFKRTAQEEKEFREILPQNGFIAKYMEYTDRSEAPGSYHFWSCVSLLSAVLERNTWIDRGTYKLYPNTYIVLVGPTGKTRKSAAIRMAKEIAERLDFLNIVADMTSTESFLESIGAGEIKTEANSSATGVTLNFDAHGVVMSSELSVFLNKLNYTSQIVQILTDIYASPSV